MKRAALRDQLGFTFAQHSPGQRIFLLDPPTSYIFNPATGHIVGRSNYVFNALQSTVPGGTTTRLVTPFLACNMTYGAGNSLPYRMGHIPVYGERCLRRLDSSQQCGVYRFQCPGSMYFDDAYRGCLVGGYDRHLALDCHR